MNLAMQAMFGPLKKKELNKLLAESFAASKEELPRLEALAASRAAAHVADLRKAARAPSTVAELRAEKDALEAAQRKAKARGKAPRWSEVEQSTAASQKAHVAGLPKALARVIQRKTLRTAVDEIRQMLEGAGLKHLSDEVNEGIFELSAADFINKHGSPRIKEAYAKLLKDAELERVSGRGQLMEETTEFANQGKMGGRRPDNIEVRLDGASPEVSITDTTTLGPKAGMTARELQELRAKTRLHEFKSNFYAEAIQAIFGPKLKVSAVEHNPILGIHKRAY